IIIQRKIRDYLIKNEDFYQALTFSQKISHRLYRHTYEYMDEEILKTLFPDHYRQWIEQYCSEYQVEPALAFAVMREESRYHPQIRSWANAVGLMQILPQTAEWLAPKMGIKDYNLDNPQDNIHFGVFYLKFLERYFTEKELILACYNAGQGNVLRWHKKYQKYSSNEFYEIIPFAETRNYIRKVMRSYYLYQHLYYQ
ncbi:MAG: lytic transglycosylase domain-containing protein, partial [Spirochaetes bacterium]|nr:lytic transglycosylase domain-containing protein [Spirochaetota bacterium]